MSLQIPGHHLAPVIFASLAVYMTSVWSLIQRSTNDKAGHGQPGEHDNVDKDAISSETNLLRLSNF